MIGKGLRITKIHRIFVLPVLALLLTPTVGARAATSLSIVIAGEPWKDPSTSAVGTIPSISTPPKDGTIALGW